MSSVANDALLGNEHGHNECMYDEYEDMGHKGPVSPPPHVGHEDGSNNNVGINASSSAHRRTAPFGSMSLIFFMSGVQYAVERPSGFMTLYLEQDLSFPPQRIGAFCTLALFTQVLGAPVTTALVDASPRPLTLAGMFLMMNAFLRATLYVPTLARWLAPDSGVASWELPAWWPWVAILAAQAGINSAMSSFVQARVVQCCGPDGYGGVRLWGGIGYAAGSLFCGAVVQASGGETSAIFAMSPIACAALAAVSLLLPARPATRPSVGDEASAQQDEVVGGWYERLAVFIRLCDGPLALFFVSTAALGFCFMSVEVYVLVLVDECGGSELFMGLLQVLMIVSEVPAFAYSGVALKRFGSHSIICFALFTYGVRMLWYSQIEQTPKGALMFLPAELLHGITYSIFNAAAVVHLARLAPPGTETTAQGLLRATQQGVGGALGTLAGGWGYAAFGLQHMYLYWAFAVLPLAVVVWVLGWLLGSDVGRPSERRSGHGHGPGDAPGVAGSRLSGIAKDAEAAYGYSQLPDGGKSGERSG